MEFPTTEILSLIYHLLPGFIAAWLYYAFTAHPIKSPFERTVQALIFTGFVKCFVILTKGVLLWFGRCGSSLGPLTSDGEYIISIVGGFVVGIIFTIGANTNCLHSRLPNWITKKSSYASEWYGVFHQTERWIYLHLKDQRRLYGWASQWPDSPTTGHFVLSFAEWIWDDNTRIPLLATEKILIPARDVVLVEFEKVEEEIWQINRQRHDQAVAEAVAKREEFEASKAEKTKIDVDAKIEKKKPAGKRKRKS